MYSNKSKREFSYDSYQSYPEYSHQTQNSLASIRTGQSNHTKCRTYCHYHWNCFGCRCTTLRCSLAFFLFLCMLATVLLIVAWLAGYIFSSAPIKPNCCIPDLFDNDTCQTFNHTLWTNVLRRGLHPNFHTLNNDIISTLVDYNSITADNDFWTYINHLSNANLSQLTCNGQFTLYVNAYNALAIKMIINHRKNGKYVGSIQDINQYWGLRSVWRMKAGTIGGLHYSLDNIEHDTLLKYWNDSRVHSALTCTALSCPDLRTTAYETHSISDQLNYQVMAWLNNTTKGMKISANKNTLILSAIFDWYSEQFKPSVKEFVMNHAWEGLTDAIETTQNKEFFSYDWSLNIFGSEI